MAGLFQVLWGEAGGKFRSAEVLKGNDDEPLLLPHGAKGDNADVSRICTRAFVADLDDDGSLDLVSGNFGGTFALFLGEETGGFSPEAKWLTAAGSPMQVAAHSDPCLVDWDGDGDLDLLSGSSQGGAFLFPNVGTKAEPKFGAMVTLVEASGNHAGDTHFGDSTITAPSSSTRVWVDDIDGDGTLDLLIGDSIRLLFPLEGSDEATTQKLLSDWEAEEKKILERMTGSGGTDDAAQKEYGAHLGKRETLVREEMTGFIWLLKGKSSGSAGPAPK